MEKLGGEGGGDQHEGRQKKYLNEEQLANLLAGEFFPGTHLHKLIPDPFTVQHFARALALVSFLKFLYSMYLYTTT